MDRSFLSDRAVIEASRAFVCVRLLTYENKEEAEFLETVFRGRQGTLENTVFTFFSPDAKKQLIRSGRTPKMVYGGSGKSDIAEMVDQMSELAGKYPAKKDVAREVPRMENLRLGLNTAACDGLPLVVYREDVEKKLATQAWSDEFVGRFIYVRLAKSDDLSTIGDPKGVLSVVQPGTFGLDGKVIATTLEEGLKKFRAEKKDEGRHISEGRRKGIDWKTPVPVTDPGPPK